MTSTATGPLASESRMLKRQLWVLLPLFLALTAITFVLQYLPLPKNLTELVSQSSPFGLALSLVALLHLGIIYPLSLCTKQPSALHLLARIFIADCLLWLVLSQFMAAESLFDVLGSPIYRWPWEWELIIRFWAWLWLIQLAFMAACSPPRIRGLSLLLLLPVACFSYAMIVMYAATDNITELLRQPFGLLAVFTYLLILAKASQWLAHPYHIGPRLLLYCSVWPISFICLWFSIEPNVEKYGLAYHGLSFILGQSRQGNWGFWQLLLLYIPGYIVVMMILVQSHKLIRHSLRHTDSRVSSKIEGNSSAQASSLQEPESLSLTNDSTMSVWPLFIYALLIAYGTLFPFTHWQGEPPAIWSVLLSAPEGLSLTDIIVNSVIYLPLGFMLLQHLKSPIWQRYLWVGWWGFALSYCLEYLQFFLPHRNTSYLDLILNTTGAFIGALIAARYRQHIHYGGQLKLYYHGLFNSGSRTLVGVLTCIFLLLAYLAPLQPNLSPAGVWHSIKPLLSPHLAPWNFYEFGRFLLQFIALGLLLRATLKPLWHSYIAIVPWVLWLIQPAFLYHQLNISNLTATLLASFTLIFACRQRQITAKQYSVIAWVVLTWLILNSLTPGQGPSHAFNWSPFYHQLQNLSHAVSMFNPVWAVFALAFCAISTHPKWFIKRELQSAIAIFILFLLLEAVQLMQPGRYPDLTDALIASISWIFVLHFWRNHHPQCEQPIFSPLPYWPIGVFSLVLLLLGTLVSVTQYQGQDLQRQYPSRVQLQGFHSQRPRLPAPSTQEIQLLLQDQSYINTLLPLAQGGKLHAQVELALLSPGSIDLNRLHQALLAQTFSGRGNHQVKPLATAYDWLYPQWSAEQRQSLLLKLLAGCQYQVDFIQQQALSPYNVYLYNSPFQALMACAIAGYQDHPEFEPVMAFTAHFWLQNVLPVWRQVMGQNGGWHEGNEYIGIGIGQAIYQLPAMWRKATGQDLFKEPGIQGFADFLLARIRPDGSSMRYGDGRFFDRAVPDQLALAREIHHHATLEAVPNSILAPSSWPWGPVQNPVTPTSYPAKPWFQFFDGIGHATARSDNSKNATYVNFRAGNNYWSHQHLDQGSFTIFKGQALALDSGYYGPFYGSDHHLNYSYQSIAHNTLTVTAAGDTVPMPPKQDNKDNSPSRDIANDGGQRRIGSGWGVPAPVSLHEWQQQYDTYHTATMLQLEQTPELFAAWADITPAYSNSQSGSGDFSSRQRRVESAKRLFIYDRQLDTALVFDLVTASRAEDVKRWLLHTSVEPRRISPHHYETQGDKASLYIDVLLPRRAETIALGGPGFAFYVDGHNYDANGEIKQKVAAARPPQPEPGQWRLEILPRDGQLQDQFLVMLTPRLAQQEKLLAQAFEGDEQAWSFSVWHPTNGYQLTLSFDAQAERINLLQVMQSQQKIWSFQMEDKAYHKSSH
ncbi:VanZ family protein [Motilimonas pumila]|nr:VanZ family protein [Motilimonas pumila]